MKVKLFVLFGLVILFGLKSFSQAKESHLPLIILIDGDIPSAGISKGIFLVQDISLDTIPFKYSVGRAIVTNRDYIKLTSLKPKSQVIMKFRYYRSFPHNVPDEHYDYEVSLNSKYINDDYIVLKVYNYANPVNNNYYPSKTGYGIEVSTPYGGTLLPVKKPMPYKPLQKMNKL